MFGDCSKDLSVVVFLLLLDVLGNDLQLLVLFSSPQCKAFRAECKLSITLHREICMQPKGSVILLHERFGPERT